MATQRGEVYAGRRKQYRTKDGLDTQERKAALRDLVQEIGRNRDPDRLLKRKMERNRKNREAEKKRKEKW